MELWKLNGFWKPYWINNDKVVSYNHIEDLKIPYPVWEKWDIQPNFNWTDIHFFECFAPINEKGLEYLKIKDNAETFYYKLIDNKSIGTKDSDGNLICKYSYELDTYQTYIWKLLRILVENDCLVHFKRSFRNRLEWDKNKEKYVLNILSQQHLTEIIPQSNLRTKRTFVNATNPENLFNNNKGAYSVTWDVLSNTESPYSESIHRWDSDSSPTWNVNLTEWFTSSENINGFNNYYYYIIAKSSCLRKVQDNKDLSVKSSQKIVVIPIIPSLADEIYHSLFDISIVGTQDACLIVGTPNDTHMSQLPYVCLWDYYKNNTSKVQFLYGVNKTNNNEDIKVPFFLMDYNLPILKKIFQYGAFTPTGLGGKIEYLLSNLDKLLPETEPLMLTPSYYYETYNNGINQFSTSLRNFVVESSSGERTPQDRWLVAYFHIFQGLDMSFYFGDETNVNDSALDYTNTTTVDVSYPLAVGVGASAVYLENNLNTGLTGLLNRNNEKAAAASQTALSAASEITGLFNPVNWFSKGVGAVKTVQTALNISNKITQTTMEQQRADRSFYASIKNTANAPQTITNKPFSKSSLPIYSENSNYLFPIFAIELTEKSRDKVFCDYLNNGYVYDAEDSIATFLNRKYMNVLSCDYENAKSEILYLWEKEFDSKIFKNKYWFNEALLFLSDIHQFYMTPFLINCTDWKRDDYIHNTEIEPINITSGKININTIITNLRDLYQDDITEIWLTIQEDNNILDEVMNELIITKDNTGFTITVSPNSLLLTGEVIVSAYLYNYVVEYLDNSTTITDYCRDIEYNFLAESIDDIASKYTYSKNSISVEKITRLTCINSITNIPQYFLANYRKFNGVLSLPRYCLYIGNWFMHNCTSFNQPLTLPNGLMSFGVCFLSNCTSFNQPITFPTTMTSFGNQFLYKCTSFNQPLTLPNGILTLNQFLEYCTSFNQPLSLPNTLISIGTNFLYNCTSFNQPLSLPNTLISIGNQFLYNCKSFNQALSLSSNLESIGDYFFSVPDVNLYNMHNITFPQSLKSIGSYLFASNSLFRINITLPSSITYIGSNMFYSCYLQSTITETDSTWGGSIIFNCSANVYTSQVLDSDLSFKQHYSSAPWLGVIKHGIDVSGSYAVEWRSKFPRMWDNNTQIGRNLISLDN